MPSDDDGLDLSPEAREKDDFYREALSEITGEDLRRKPPKTPDWLKDWRFIVAALLTMIVIVFVIIRPDIGSETADIPGSGPLQGSWDMYATWPDESERGVFTIVFDGDGESGDIEVLEDTYPVSVSETAYVITGSEIWFGFTRTFDTDAGPWTEQSDFEGTIDGDTMTGTWTRQSWECSPDECRYDGDDASYKARLARRP